MRKALAGGVRYNGKMLVQWQACYLLLKRKFVATQEATKGQSRSRAKFLQNFIVRKACSFGVIMSESEKFSKNLEKVAFLELGFSMFACIGSSQGYNVALAFFTLYSAYSRVGRINAVGLVAHVGSLLIDIVLLGLYGDHWSNAGHQYAFAMAMIIINLFVKCLGVGCMFFIFNDLGGDLAFPNSASGNISSSQPVGYHKFGRAPELADEHYNPIASISSDQSYQASAPTVSTASGRDPRGKWSAV